MIRGLAGQHRRRSGSRRAIIRPLNEMKAVARSHFWVDPCERARSGLLDASWAVEGEPDLLVDVE